MALMAPTQAAPTPHHPDRDPRFRAAGICSLPPPKTDWNHVTEKHLLPPQRSDVDSTGDPPAFFC